jgi:hypothetical protein
MNSVNLIGRLTRDPELVTTGGAGPPGFPTSSRNGGETSIRIRRTGASVTSAIVR